MTDQRLIEFVKNALSNGILLEQIKQALLEKGWAEKDIDEAINFVAPQTISGVSASQEVFTPASSNSVHEEPIHKELTIKNPVKQFPKVWLIIILGIIIAGGIFAYFMLGGKETPAGTGTSVPNMTVSMNQPDISLLNLDILIPKSNYEAGEILSGEYYMSYTGKPFEGIVLYANSKVGFEKKYSSQTMGTIENIDFNNPEKTGMLKVALQAFRYNENGYSCCLENFAESGTYTFTISVYDCSTIEKELNKACNDAEGDELFNITELKSVSKNIVVSGGSIIQCESSSDCTETCEGCTSEKQICEQGRGVCMDCFMDLQCKEGHSCTENKCTSG